MSSEEALATVANAAASSSAPLENPPRGPSASVDYFDIQLPTACINLLYVLSCLVPKCRQWLSAATGGRHLFRLTVLPMLLHPLISARRAGARATAAVLLGGLADKWSGWASACATADLALSETESASNSLQQQHHRPALLHLPEVFAAGFLLPCSVTWVAIKARGKGDQQNEQLVGGFQLKTSPLLGLMSEQRFLVQILVEERRVLRQERQGDAGAQSRDSLLGLILDTPGTHELPPVAAQACAANVRALDLNAQAHAVAAALSAASSHAEASMAILEARGLAATTMGAAALAGCPGWRSALEPLLRTCPATKEDRELWALLLPVVQRVLLAGMTPSAPHHLDHMAQLHVHLALCLAQSAPALLSAPGAARPPMIIPLALAGSKAAVGRPAVGTSSWESLAGVDEDSPDGSRGQRLVLQLTLAMLQLLSTVTRCV